jgi:putative hydrolase
MATMDTSGGFPFDFEGMDPEALRDAPLFRELQRVMASSTGPVNWELARQVGIATALEGGDDAAPTEQDQHLFDEAVRVAELHVTRLTGLEPPGDMAVVQPVRRSDWLTASIVSLRGLLEPAAARMGQAMGRAMSEQLPSEAQGAAGLLNQLGPLLQGTQVGQVFGMLAQRVAGQYDIGVPHEGAGTLLFVVPNIASFEHDWSLDPTEFRTSIALHEVTHRFEFARGWAREYFVGLVDDFLSTITIDVDVIRQRLEGLDPSDPEGLQKAFESDEGGLFGAVLDDEQRLKLARIQAFMAAAEGYGDHVMHALGRELLPSYERISEATRRRHEGQPADPVFERLLGVEMKRAQYDQGRSFCDTVVDLTDESTLARMWDSAEALPSLPEIVEPRLWLARTV